MVDINIKTNAHPAELELADFLAGGLSKNRRERLEKHLGACDQCLAGMVAAYESVATLNKKKLHKKFKDTIMKKINIYLALAIISFVFSFIMPRYFIQLLVATLLLGIKWIVDSKTTKMLVMIYEAWKTGGDKEASRVLGRIGNRDQIRF